jgi:hypothetical protein
LQQLHTQAIKELEFHDFEDKLQDFLVAFREEQERKKASKASKKGKEEDDEPEEQYEEPQQEQPDSMQVDEPDQAEEYDDRANASGPASLSPPVDASS